MTDLSDIETCYLVNELARRDGVIEIECTDPSSAFAIRGHGPARIMVVID